MTHLIRLGLASLTAATLALTGCSLPDDPSKASPDDGGVGALALAAARSYEGIPFEWGGNDRDGIGSSGLIARAFADIGYNVPLGTTRQFDEGTEVPVEEARAGDLVFSQFGNSGPEHVAFVVEPGRSYYEAQQPGVPVGEHQRWADDSVVKSYGVGELERTTGSAD